MANPPPKRFSWPVPSDEQRTFVCAAAAVGLSVDQICRMFPPKTGGLKKMTPERLAGFFPDELDSRGELAWRLVTLRLLQKALLNRDREATAAELAVLKTLPDWRKQLPTTEPTAELAVERLTDQERAELRRLIDKADPLRPAPDPSDEAEEDDLPEAGQPGARGR